MLLCSTTLLLSAYRLGVDSCRVVAWFVVVAHLIQRVNGLSLPAGLQQQWHVISEYLWGVCKPSSSRDGRQLLSGPLHVFSQLTRRLDSTVRCARTHCDTDAIHRQQRCAGRRLSVARPRSHVWYPCRCLIELAGRKVRTVTSVDTIVT